ncbi:MAG: hypothetical protein U0230_20040 [Polyangiales bacterium]
MKTDTVERAYRHEGESLLVELEVRAPAQLFNTLDPSPFHERDLADAAARYILESLRDLHQVADVKLVVHIDDESSPDTEKEVSEAVHNHFRYLADSRSHELRLLLSNGRLSLFIGLTFLVGCVGIAQTVFRDSGISREMLREGLTIMGWVAMWRPIQVFLYDWWPIWRERRLCERIASMPVEVRLRGKG